MQMSNSVQWVSGEEFFAQITESQVLSSELYYNRDISEIPHPFIIESLELFNNLENIDKAKVYFIHLNHTNPVLNKNSEEYKRVILSGFNVAEPGMEFVL